MEDTDPHHLPGKGRKKRVDNTMTLRTIIQSLNNNKMIDEIDLSYKKRYVNHILTVEQVPHFKGQSGANGQKICLGKHRYLHGLIGALGWEGTEGQGG